MARIEASDIMRYFLMGAIAVILPGFLMGIEKVAEFMATMPVFNFEILGVTLGSILLAGLSILAVDQLVYKQ